MPEQPDAFGRNLDRRLGWWRTQVVVVESLRLLSWLLGAWLLILIYDLVSPLETRGREFVAGFFLAAAIVFWACGLWRSRSIDRRQVAAELDRIEHDPRRTLSAAVDLETSETGAAWLRAEALRRANRRVEAITSQKARPARAIRLAGWSLLGVTGVVLLAFVIWPVPLGTAAARLFQPNADIPPYSGYVFRIQPENPEVVYGGAIDLAVEIEGSDLDQPVYLLTRAGEQVERTECFRAPGNRFTQRLENVTQPVEFAFATGKTRTRWQPLSVLLEPRFALAKATVTPPAYTGQAPFELLAGSAPLEMPAGSRVSLHVTSNRPLSRGRLAMPEAPVAADRLIEGEMSGLHTVRFDWTAHHAGPMEIQIFDALGTPSREPLLLQLGVQPDVKPDLALVQPPFFSLATPITSLPVQGRAEDDHGLRRVALIRSMPGYRERGETLGEGQLGKRFEIEDRLELAELGVRPGDVLEFYLEGRDHNPSQLGIQTSPVSRVEIITEEAYAEEMRRRIAFQDLSRKYGAIQQELNRMRQALQEARDAAEGEPDQRREALEKSARELQKAAERLRHLSEDYPAFHIEKALQRELEKKAEQIEQASKQLQQLSGDDPQLGENVAALQEQLDPEGDQLGEQMGEMEDFLKVARVMEEAARLRRLADTQQQLAEMFDRQAGPGGEGAEAAANAERLEQGIRDQLAEMPQRIRDAADGLEGVEGHEKTASDARDFADALEKNAANQQLDSAIESAQLGNMPDTAKSARDAARSLKDLIGDRAKGEGAPGGCRFAGMCQGQSSGEGPNGISLEQFLKASMSRGFGFGGEGGSGAGGSADDGFATRGFLDLQLPVFGPMRLQFDPQSESITSMGSESDATIAEAPLQTEKDSLETDRSAAAARGERTSFSKQIPEKYRGAVQRYFQVEP